LDADVSFHLHELPPAPLCIQTLRTLDPELSQVLAVIDVVVVVVVKLSTTVECCVLRYVTESLSSAWRWRIQGDGH